VSSTLCTNSKAFEETPFDGLFISARICLMVAKLVNNGRPSHMEPTATCNALMGHSQLAFLRISFVPCVGAETTEVLPSSPFSCHYRRSYECCHEIPFASCFFFPTGHIIFYCCVPRQLQRRLFMFVFSDGGSGEFLY
jgi:hypothetical protein